MLREVLLAILQYPSTTLSESLESYYNLFNRDSGIFQKQLVTTVVPAEFILITPRV